MSFVILGTDRPSPDVEGEARSAPTVKRSLCNSSKSEFISGSFDTAHTKPSTEFNSSTFPYATTLEESFEIRAPPTRPVLPWSPVRVYILAKSLCSGLNVWKGNLEPLVSKEPGMGK